MRRRVRRGASSMKTLLGSIVAAAALAGAATFVTGPDSAAGFVTALPPGLHQAQVNRAARTDRLPATTTIFVKTIRTLPVDARREQHPATIPVNCETLVSPLADIAASRRVRQCMT